jgi:hypothetical protein
MDTTLIEAGLQHYAALLKMSLEEQTDFRQDYFQRYNVEDRLLIWCELTTCWAELHLGLDRWTIFIEDDAINQYEPVRILDESRPRPQVGADWPTEFGTRGRGWGWEIHQKTLMLCFPKSNPVGNPVLSPDTRFLKLIFQLSDDEETRAEGVWAFKE